MFKTLRLSVVGLLIAVSMIVLVQSVLAVNNADSKPGWGFGDTNHIHTGPPGSVNPVNHGSNSIQVSNNVTVNATTGGGNPSDSGSLVTGAISFVVNVTTTISQILPWF